MSVSLQYFRAGVGIVPYTSEFQLIIFERSDFPGVWQFPQGGLDEGEDLESALWRELREETGIMPSDVSARHLFPHWLFYEFPQSNRAHLSDPRTLGQIHRWYFLEIKQPLKIDLAASNHQEFKDWRLGSFTDVIGARNGMKDKVFMELNTFFEQNIKK